MSHIKQTCQRHDFGHFDESHSKKDISPFSNKMFNFSGTKCSRITYYHGQQSSAQKKGRLHQNDMHNFDTRHTPVNPFNNQYSHRIPKDSGSIFGGASHHSPSPTNRKGFYHRDEEDFEIKPHNIYGQNSNQ